MSKRTTARYTVVETLDDYGRFPHQMATLARRAWIGDDDEPDRMPDAIKLRGPLGFMAADPHVVFEISIREVKA